MDPPDDRRTPDVWRPRPATAGDDDTIWSFARLLRALLDLPGDFRVRLSSIEVTEIPDEVINLAAGPPQALRFLSYPASSPEMMIFSSVWGAGIRLRNTAKESGRSRPGYRMSRSARMSSSASPGKGKNTSKYS